MICPQCRSREVTKKESGSRFPEGNPYEPLGQQVFPGFIHRLVVPHGPVQTNELTFPAGRYLRMLWLDHRPFLLNTHIQLFSISPTRPSSSRSAYRAPLFLCPLSVLPATGKNRGYIAQKMLLLLCDHIRMKLIFRRQPIDCRIPLDRFKGKLCPDFTAVVLSVCSCHPRYSTISTQVHLPSLIHLMGLSEKRGPL